jgi:SAM-dependent methyltransferase
MGYYRNPEPGELEAIYREAWRDPTFSGRFAAGSTSQEIAASILSAMTTGSEITACLDYGGGSGGMAAALLHRGATDVTVVEPFGAKARIAGVKWISDLQELPGQAAFSHIFMVEVIEHLLEPVAELKTLKNLLAPGGKLIVTTPNASGWRARLAGTEWREAQNPTHIQLFSPLSLRRCLQSAGFSRVRRIYRPVRYGASGVRASALVVSQMLGIDGGIRVIASADR